MEGLSINLENIKVSLTFEVLLHVIHEFGSYIC